MMFPLTQAAEGGISRFEMFVNAVAMVSDRIDILFIVAEADLVVNQDEFRLSEQLGRRWGFPVNARFVLSRRARTGFWQHYVAGIFSARSFPDFAHYTGPEQMAAFEQAVGGGHDLVFISSLSMIVPMLAIRRWPKRVFFDLNDVEHLVQSRATLQPPFWPGKLAYLAQVPALFFAEWRAARRSEASFVCSEHDRNSLCRLGFPKSVVAIPNAVVIPCVPAPLTAAPSLLFLGGYNYPPNRIAAARLINAIWPKIKASMPEARLILAGKNPEAIPGFADSPEGVEFTGFVEDLDALYARARVVVCPITTGSGTRLKLLGAAAQGKPMVSTSIGAEGLDFRHQNEILICDGDAGFADACITLLSDDAACQALGNAARAMVAQRYDLKVITASLARIFA